MKHYINKNKEIFGFELDGSQDHLITDDMEEISEEEIQIINLKKEDEYKQTLEYKLIEAQILLDKTQHKFGGDYEPKEGEDLEELRAKRSVARKFIRENK